MNFWSEFSDVSDTTEISQDPHEEEDESETKKSS